MTRDCESCGRPTDSDTTVFRGKVWRLCPSCRERIVDWVEGGANPGVSCGRCDGPVDVEVRPGGPSSGPTLGFECYTCGWSRTSQYVGEQ